MTKQIELTAYTGATLFTGANFVENQALLVQNGQIIDIIPANDVPCGTNCLHYPNTLISAGLIDSQVNGGGNILFNSSPSAESLLKMAESHAAFGTKSLLPTCITDSADVMKQALDAVRMARLKNDHILGIHFEGPFINPIKAGCHPRAHIRALTEADKTFLTPQNGEIILLTLAPECVEKGTIGSLTDRGVKVAIGHSAASADDISNALAEGAIGFTHLFNAMTGLSARAPGVAGCALDSENAACGIIADGFHVADEMIRLAQKSKKRGKLFFVSDAMPPAATKNPEPFILSGEKIVACDGKCLNAAGTLAGSAITLADAVAYAVNHVGIDKAEALRMATLYVASYLGIENKFGRLAKGYDSEITIFDSNLKTYNNRKL